MRATLNVLATVAPEWLRTQVSPEWVDRYEKRFEGYRLPKSQVERQQDAEVIGAGGFQLLSAISSETAPSWLREVPMVQVLRQVWVQQYYAPGGPVRWRAEEDRPPSALQIHFPYDVEARAPSARFCGRATKCISPRPVMRNCPI
jgi:transposase